MKLHSLQPTVPRKPRKRVGRGNGNNWGRTAGRGEKGQKSRSGYSYKSYFEGGQIPLFRRLPKRGFNHSTHKSYALVNVADLEEHFNQGDVVELQTLQERGMIRHIGAGIKVLGNGEVTKALTVKANRFSAAAMEKIQKAGGTCHVV